MVKVTQQLIDELMRQALDQAVAAAAVGEVPVGAVLGHIQSGEVIAAAHNLVETELDASAHAERLVISAAGKKKKGWRLEDAVLCVTLEPCPMCVGAIRLARIPVIVYGAPDPRMGAMGSLFDLSIDSRLGPVPRVISGVCEREARDLLQRFFSDRRRPL